LHTEEEGQRLKIVSLLFCGRRVRAFLVGLGALCLLFAVAACGGSNPVRIYDHAHVLESSSVQKAASNLPYPFDIYTTSTFRGDTRAFDQTTIRKLGGNPERIVMAIDTLHRHLYIARGGRVPLSESEISSTVNAFVTHFGSGDYTGATVAAIETLRRSLSGERTSSFLSAVFPVLLCLSLLLLAAVGVFGLMRRRLGTAAAVRSSPMYSSALSQGAVNPWMAAGLPGYELGDHMGSAGRDCVPDV
jgi:hypothetical protein